MIGWQAKLLLGKGSERDLLISVSLNSMKTMRTGMADAKAQQVLRGMRGTAVSLAGALLLTGAAWGQIQAPRYQSPLQAPKPQLTLPVAPAITPNGSVVEYPIVRVNDQIIDNSDYQRAQQQLTEEAQRQNVPSGLLAQEQKDLLRDMIDQQLLLSRGKELDINSDADVIRQLDAIRKQNNLDTMEDLEKAVRQSGISYEDFKAGIKNQIVSQQVVGREVGQNIRMTTKQEQAYYDQHKQEFAQAEQVQLSEILIPTAEDATEAQIAQAKAKADDVVTKLKAGGNFEELAKQNSAGQTASTGGDLGTFKRGALGSSALEDPVFAIKAGENTAPIRTRQGFVVLKVTEHTQAGIPPLTAVEPQVQDALYREAIQPALRTYLTGLREKAYIEIAPGFVDTGSSAKETKPVFSSATVLPVKKKELKARLDQGRKTTLTAKKGAAAKAGPTTSIDETKTSDATNAKTKTVSSNKKPKTVRKEKIRFGQAPRNSLPSVPNETLAPGADQGTDVASSGLPGQGDAITTLDQPTSMASEELPLNPEVERKKTRYSDRAPIEDKARRDAAKEAKAKQLAAVAAPLSVDDQLKQKAQNSALGLGGDTATKKKAKKVKGAPKERLQEQAPAPPAPKPEGTPIPPRSVRENGEPVVSPPPVVPTVTAPADAPASSTTK